MRQFEDADVLNLLLQCVFFNVQDYTALNLYLDHMLLRTPPKFLLIHGCRLQTVKPLHLRQGKVLQ